MSTFNWLESISFNNLILRTFSGWKPIGRGRRFLVTFRLVHFSHENLFERRVKTTICKQNIGHLYLANSVCTVIRVHQMTMKAMYVDYSMVNIQNLFLIIYSFYLPSVSGILRKWNHHQIHKIFFFTHIDFEFRKTSKFGTEELEKCISDFYTETYVPIYL